jgi:hypothetical protein
MLVGLIVVATGAVAVLIPAAVSRLYAGPVPDAGPVPAATPSAPGRANIAAQAAPPGPTLHAAPVVTPTSPKFDKFGWAFLDRRTHTVVGSDNKDTMQNTTESMVKPWLAADYLSHLGSKQPTDAMKATITNMIENSDDTAANTVYNADGELASISRLIKTCKLTETQPGQSWSYTLISPADAVRYAECIADDNAAGPTWTTWLLSLMQNVHGAVTDNTATDVVMQGGHWGIIDALPDSLAKDTAIKNGWTYIFAEGKWHINCLAVHRDWALVVEMQFSRPSWDTAGLQQGANACASVARQLVYTPDL